MPKLRYSVFDLICGLLVCSLAQASVPKESPLKMQLRADLRQSTFSRGKNQFQDMIKGWEKTHGTKAVAHLIEIASDKKTDETLRFKALMGATKIGGKSVGPKWAPLLKDKSWMIRSGALKAIEILKTGELAGEVRKLLKDPSLLVRSQAVDTLSSIDPPNFSKDLIDVLKHGANYHGGKAQIVPYKALAAIQKATHMKNEIKYELAPLLRHESDTKLVLATLSTLDHLDKENTAPMELKSRTKYWVKKLTRN